MLKLVNKDVTNKKNENKNQRGIQSDDDHMQLIERYLQSHKIRNHSSKTIQKEEAFLNSWFKEHGEDNFLLYTWEAMKPIEQEI